MFYEVCLLRVLRQGVEWIVKASACIDDINYVDGIKERQNLDVVKEVCPEINAVKKLSNPLTSGCRITS
jgi:hypothetical protein